MTSITIKHQDPKTKTSVNMQIQTADEKEAVGFLAAVKKMFQGEPTEK